MNVDSVVSLLIALSIVVAIGATVYGSGADELREYADASEEWCEEQRGGDLVNVHAIWHGGLHCELPNGTSIHMTEVEEVQPR